MSSLLMVNEFDGTDQHNNNMNRNDKRHREGPENYSVATRINVSNGILHTQKGGGARWGKRFIITQIYIVFVERIRGHWTIARQQCVGMNEAKERKIE